MSEALGPRPMTPRRRTAILAGLSLGTAAIAAPAVYVGYQAATVFKSDEYCFVSPEPANMHNPAVRSTGWSMTHTWRWLPPQYDVKCIYEMPDGSTLVRPPPPSSK